VQPEVMRLHRFGERADASEEFERTIAHRCVVARATTNNDLAKLELRNRLQCVRDAANVARR
jgi:hypothetical protein